MKQRFCDFFVREIDPQGRVVRLTSVDIPAEPEDPREKTMPVDGALAQLNGLIGEEMCGAIAAANTANEARTFSIEKELSKADRTAVHVAIRNAFGGKVSSTTKEGALMVSTGGATMSGDFRAGGGGGGNKGNNNRGKGRLEWPKTRPDFLQFVMMKENVETYRAVSDLSRCVNSTMKSFAWYGTKDKRAVTAQLVTAYRVDAGQLLQKSKYLRGIRVGNFEYVSKALRLGQATGNSFDVVLRFCSAPPEVLQQSVEDIRRDGFVNFYGLQRFGSTPMQTHIVGLALLRGDWENVCDLVIASAGKPEWTRDRNAAAALKQIDSRGNQSERLILEALKHNPRDHYGAILKLPLNLRTLYIHAYQAYVWNVAASARLATEGAMKGPIVGDVVLLQRISPENEGEDLSFTAQVKVLESEEECGRYTLDDVLIPLPGTGVVFPHNFLGTVMKDQLIKDGIPLESWEAQAKRFPIKGGYRKLVCRPGDVQHSVLKYDDPTVPLIPTDVDLLEGRPLPDTSKGAYTALRVSFNLPSGSYATMFFRELQKRPSDRTYQDTIMAQWKTAEEGGDGAVEDE